MIDVTGKSGFTKSEFEIIKRLYIYEGRSYSQIAKILGKGSERSVRNLLYKAKLNRYSSIGTMVKPFKPGMKYGKITLVSKLAKAKKLRYHVVCDCGYEFDLDPFFLTLPDEHKSKIFQCSRCNED